MLTDFEGVQVAYRDIWELQTKLKVSLEKIQKERESHGSELTRLRKQEKAIRLFLGKQAASNAISEVSHAA